MVVRITWQEARTEGGSDAPELVECFYELGSEDFVQLKAIVGRFSEAVARRKAYLDGIAAEDPDRVLGSNKVCVRNASYFSHYAAKTSITASGRQATPLHVLREITLAREIESVEQLQDIVAWFNDDLLAQEDQVLHYGEEDMATEFLSSLMVLHQRMNYFRYSVSTREAFTVDELSFVETLCRSVARDTGHVDNKDRPQFEFLFDAVLTPYVNSPREEVASTAAVGGSTPIAVSPTVARRLAAVQGRRGRADSGPPAFDLSSVQRAVPGVEKESRRVVE